MLRKMFPRQLIYLAHNIPPFFIGLCIGISLSLFSIPYVEEDCSGNQVIDNDMAAVGQLDSKSLAFVRSRRSVEQTHKTVIQDQNLKKKPLKNLGRTPDNSSDFEPRWLTVNVNETKPKNAKDKKSAGTKPVTRPRFVAAELDIRDKLFLSIFTTSRTVNTLAVAINKTITLLPGFRTSFFMGPKEDDNIPDSLSVVSFATTDVTNHLVPFHTFRYLAEHYSATHNWFAFAPDYTYIRTQKLYDLVSRLSLARDLFFGERIKATDEFESDSCTLDGGFVISGSILMKAANQLDWCIKMAKYDDDGENIGACIQHASNLTCTSVIKEMKYMSYDIGPTKIDAVLKKNDSMKQISQAFSVYPFDDAPSIYKIHRYVSQLELNETKVEIEALKKDITEISMSGPGGLARQTWPIGAEPPFKPKAHFDVIRWDYFTTSVIYLKDDFSIVAPLKGIDLDDVNNAIARVKDALQKEFKGKITYRSLMNGYRRFDATRGMEYILDVIVFDNSQKKISTKRVEIVKPLGDVEIVPMPYVTENTRVHILLTITVETKQDINMFMEKYAKVCLETADNAHLYVIFLYKSGMPMTGSKDPYALLKSVITFYENKFHNGAKITRMNVQLPKDNVFLLMDVVGPKFPADSLLLFLTVSSEFDLDFLNRVRMNTIYKTQVYFPVAFWQYKPNIIYAKKPYPESIELTQKTGHFDKNSFIHFSFYMGDYSVARTAAIKKRKNLGKMDLADLFLDCHTLHVFRATEPNLRHFWKLHQCKPQGNEDEYSRCLASKASGLASSAQLATLILESQGNTQSKSK